jgi:hypothetical protein
MQMQPVRSSNIAAVGYENGTLAVRFHNGSEYEYPGTSESDHADFLGSESKGRWLNQFVALRSGVTRTKTSNVQPVKKEANAVKAEQSNSSAAFAGGVMRSQISRTTRTATFRVPRVR